MTMTATDAEWRTGSGGGLSCRVRSVRGSEGPPRPRRASRPTPAAATSARSTPQVGYMRRGGTSGGRAERRPLLKTRYRSSHVPEHKLVVASGLVLFLSSCC